MEYDYGPWDVIMGSWNVNRGPWNSIMRKHNDNSVQCSVITGRSNVSRGLWNVKRGPGM